jgi:alpha-mannosidase
MSFQQYFLSINHRKAQQYEWLLEDQPQLFSRIKEKVKSGNFIPIGGVSTML